MARKASDPHTQAPKSERTRQRILDAAAQVLSTKGFAGTRLADVAERAELQAPAIYYYFDSREELVEEVMWAGISRIHDHVAGVLGATSPEADPLLLLDTAVAAHLRFELELSDYTTAAIRNAGQVPEHVRLRYATEATEYGALWSKLLKDAHTAGLLRADLDLRLARMVVLGALNWAAEWWPPARTELKTVVATAQSMVRNGLGTARESRTSTPEDTIDVLESTRG